MSQGHKINFTLFLVAILNLFLQQGHDYHKGIKGEELSGFHLAVETGLPEDSVDYFSLNNRARKNN
jgi:hypothetical protein